MESIPSQSLTTEDVEDMLSKVYALLKSKGIPRMQFYAEIGISAGAMSQWKLGKTTPTYNSIAKIADYLGVTVDELTGDTTQKTAAPKGDGLDEDTLKLARCYQSMNAEGRKAMRALAKVLAQDDDNE